MVANKSGRTRAAGGGRKRDPAEVKRKRGSKGQAPIEVVDVEIVGVDDVPLDPPRPLGPNGQKLWELIWRTTPWMAEPDMAMCQMLCEMEDERTVYRHKALQDPEKNWRMIAAARRIEVSQISLMIQLGLSPISRSSINLAVSSAARNVTAIESARRRNTERSARKEAIE